MQNAYFRFYDELNDFLPSRQRETTITHRFDWRASIKDMIESLGVPHAEVDVILVNDEAVDFSHIVVDGDDVHVYPRSEMVAADTTLALRPPLPRRVCFVLDTHLGRLAAYLRMMGFDSLYRNDYPDDELALISYQQGRILLTRDIGLLKRSLVVHGYFVRATNPRRQLKEVMQRFELHDRVAPFKHCMKCNGLLAPVDKQAVIDQLPSSTAQHYEQFHQCQNCAQVYWKGPHFQRMQALIVQALGD